MKTDLKTILSYAGISILVVLVLFSTICGVAYIVNFDRPATYAVYEEMTRLHYDATKYELVVAVDNYIQKNGKNSCLNGVTVVDKCIEHNVDICFVLAQGQLESNFGTAGLARKTNSVWNVLAFDGQSYDEISNKGKYKSPDESLEPYLKLLHKRYLVDGKTEYHMMQDFSDKNGKKYASAENYEVMLRNQYEQIKQKTQIDSLVQELKKYSIILGY